MSLSYLHIGLVCVSVVFLGPDGSYSFLLFLVQTTRDVDTSSKTNAITPQDQQKMMVTSLAGNANVSAPTGRVGKLIGHFSFAFTGSEIQWKPLFKETQVVETAVHVC